MKPDDRISWLGGNPYSHASERPRRYGRIVSIKHVPAGHRAKVAVDTDLHGARVAILIDGDYQVAGLRLEE